MMRVSLALCGGTPTRTRPVPAWPIRDAATRRAATEVHDEHTWWQNGTSPAEILETWLRDYYGRAAIATSSGTTATEIGLNALGIGAGDEVLVPATTFVSAATAVSAVGAIPVPVDVDPRTLTLDVDAAEAARTSRARAVIAVHLAGHPADTPAIAAWARRHGLAFVEDSAQAVTAAWDGARVATTGDAAILSFHEAKLLPGGSGGALLIGDQQAARQAELLANNGRPRGSGTYDHHLVGTNARIDVFSAALALARTGDLNELWQIRDQRRAQLDRALTDAGVGGLLVGPHPRVTRHDHYAVLLRCPNELGERGVHAATLAAALIAEGIPAKPLFPPWQTAPAYADHPHTALTPHAEHAAATIVALAHPLLLDADTPTDVPAAITKLTAAASELLTWQEANPCAPAVADGGCR